MLARECVSENAGVAGYVEAFRRVLSGKQASIRSSYLSDDVLACGMEVKNKYAGPVRKRNRLSQDLGYG